MMIEATILQFNKEKDGKVFSGYQDATTFDLSRYEDGEFLFYSKDRVLWARKEDGTVTTLLSIEAVSYTHLTLPTTPYV